MITDPDGQPHPSRNCHLAETYTHVWTFLYANSSQPSKYHGSLRAPFKIAYGKFPHALIDYIDLKRTIDEKFITSLDEDQLRFILLANQL